MVSDNARQAAMSALMVLAQEYGFAGDRDKQVTIGKWIDELSQPASKWASLEAVITAIRRRGHFLMSTHQERNAWADQLEEALRLLKGGE